MYFLKMKNIFKIMSHFSESAPPRFFVSFLSHVVAICCCFVLFFIYISGPFFVCWCIFAHFPTYIGIIYTLAAFLSLRSARNTKIQ